MSKLIERILKDKKYIKSLQGSGLLEDLVADYVDSAIPLKTRPNSGEKTNYIGIEFECFSRYEQDELVEKFIENNLAGMVQVGEDGSIDADFGQEYELRLLTKEKDLKKTLTKFGKVVKKGKFGVNKTCGLHIHLDMRNRDAKECYNRLIKFQDLLFSMVAKDRWNNNYCVYNKMSADEYSGHHNAINFSAAYFEHTTIEIRLHHATMDMKQIEKWISLLLTIIGTKNPPPLDTKANVLNWAKEKRGLRAYIAKTASSEWFKRNNLVANW